MLLIGWRKTACFSLDDIRLRASHWLAQDCVLLIGWRKFACFSLDDVMCMFPNSGPRHSSAESTVFLFTKVNSRQDIGGAHNTYSVTKHEQLNFIFLVWILLCMLWNSLSKYTWQQPCIIGFEFCIHIWMYWVK